MAANPTIQLGTDGNWAIKEDNLLAYKKDGDRFFNKEFDFTRNSTATYVDKDGLIKTATSDIPRIDFLNNPKGHLLLEPARTNLSLYTEQFNLWSGGLVAADQAISPDGNLTADELTKTSAYSAQSRIETGTSGVNYVFSLFVKPKTTNTITLRQASGSNDVRRYFDLSTIEGGNSGGNNTGFVSYGIEKYPNGWYRVYTVCTSNGTAISTNLYAGRAGSTTYDGRVYIWGAQLELGDYPTSYIKNVDTSAGVTRLADICNGSGTADDFNDSEGVLFANIAALANDGGSRRLSINDNVSDNDRVLIGFTSTDNQIQGQSRTGITTQAALSGTVSDVTNFSKVAMKYKANDFALWINGFEVDTDINGTAPVGITTMSFDRTAGLFPFYGKTKDLKVFKRAMSDSELYLLTVTQYQSYQEMATALNYTL